MQPFLKRLTPIFATGYILMYFGELVFWANVDPQTNLAEWVLTWLFYSYLAAVFLGVVAYFKVNNVWSLFLAGAVFGWLAEGVYAMTLFGTPEAPFPLTISFTGLAWHAQLDVLFGWYFLRQLFLENSYRKTILVAVIFGLFYGTWSIFWWLQEEPNTVPEFSLYVLSTTALLLVAHELNQRFPSSSFRYSKAEQRLIIVLPCLSFLFLTLPSIGAFSLILLPLFALLLFPLEKNRRREIGYDMSKPPSGKTGLMNYLLFLIGPLVAITIYSTAAALQLRFPTYHLFYFPSIISGFLLLGISVGKTWRR